MLIETRLEKPLTIVDFVLVSFLRSLYQLIEWVQPMSVPLCLILAWTIVGIALWSVWSAIRDGVTRARTMHQIPCAECKYFTQNYHLKCPVHPAEALSEAAIGCHDFEAAQWQQPAMKTGR